MSATFSLTRPPFTFKTGRCALGVLALCGGVHSAHAAVLSYSAYASTYGYFYTSYASPFLGNINFNFNGPSNSTSNWGGSGAITTGLAQVDYTLAAGNASGLDPVYDIVTSNGQYSFHYSGQAEANAGGLHATVTSETLDHGVGGTSTPTAVDSTPATVMYADSSAQWNEQWLIPADKFHAAGTYGATLVGITLDGQFATPNGLGSGSAYLQASSSFTDKAGVSYSSYFSTNGWTGNWNGQSVVYKKLLFQYGTAFNMSLYLNTQVGNNGQADFINTGRISQVELPFGATLETGSSQAGIGSLSTLYGQVFQSATLDAENTNWDFGNNGGGFTPNVPEPEAWALTLTGLAAVGLWGRRRRQA